MLVENALIPTGEQLGVVAGDPVTGPIVMLNLLKFRARAAYADGRDADCTGEQAYQRYADQMVPYVESRGGRLLYQGNARALVIGAVGDVWDTVALVEYPSPRAFLEIAMAPEVHAFAVHREAGLEGQLLLMLEPRA